MLTELGKRFYPAAPDRPARIQLYVAGEPLALPQPRLGLNATEAERGGALLADLTARIADHLTTTGGVAGDIAHAQAGVIAGFLASDALLDAAAPLHVTDPVHAVHQRALSLTFEGNDVRVHLTTTYTAASVRETSKVEDIQLTFTLTPDCSGEGDTHRLTVKMSGLAVRLHPGLDIPSELEKFGVTQPSPLTSLAAKVQRHCREWVEQVWARVRAALWDCRTMRVEVGVPPELATPGAWTRPPGMALAGLEGTEKYYLIAATPTHGPWSGDMEKYHTSGARVYRKGTALDHAAQQAAFTYAGTDAGRQRNRQLVKHGELNISHEMPMGLSGLSAATYRFAEDRLDEIAAECGAAELDDSRPPLLMDALYDALYQVYASPDGSVMIDGVDILKQVNREPELVRALVASGRPAEAKRLMVTAVIGRLRRAVPNQVPNAPQVRKRVLMALALAWRATQPVYDRDGAPQFKYNKGEVRTIDIVTRTQTGEKFADGTVRLSFASHHRDLRGVDARVTVGGEARAPELLRQAKMTSTARWCVGPVRPNETRERPPSCQGIYLTDAAYDATLELSPLARRARGVGGPVGPGARSTGAIATPHETVPSAVRAPTGAWPEPRPFIPPGITPRHRP
ncbi:hypothetical protein [Pandoraea oxalativorans]|uniref:hypothetical protein n=1 Tax=Pandoraea oxalativorans TaxID=573737 RepID=UPI0012F521D3|nr:hypothetical protein [Pandoraea oxalativorans]